MCVMWSMWILINHVNGFGSRCLMTIWIMMLIDSMFTQVWYVWCDYGICDVMWLGDSDTSKLGFYWSLLFYNFFLIGAFGQSFLLEIAHAKLFAEIQWLNDCHFMFQKGKMKFLWSLWECCNGDHRFNNYWCIGIPSSTRFSEFKLISIEVG